MKDTLVICFDGMPLVAMPTPQFKLLSDVLEWYAEQYDFDRLRLTGTYVDSITYQPDPRTFKQV